METKELKNDRTEWFKNHSYTEEERKQLIEDKIQKVYNQQKFNQRVKSLFTND